MDVMVIDMYGISIHSIIPFPYFVMQTLNCQSIQKPMSGNRIYSTGNVAITPT